MKIDLVDLVIILRVVLEHLRLLLVIERAGKIVYAALEVFPPFLAVKEPVTGPRSAPLSMDDALRVLNEWLEVANGKSLVDMAYIFFDASTSNLRARRNLSYTSPESAIWSCA